MLLFFVGLCLMILDAGIERALQQYSVSAVANAVMWVYSSHP